MVSHSVNGCPKIKQYLKKNKNHPLFFGLGWFFLQEAELFYHIPPGFLAREAGRVCSGKVSLQHDLVHNRLTFIVEPDDIHSCRKVMNIKFCFRISFFICCELLDGLSADIYQ